MINKLLCSALIASVSSCAIPDFAAAQTQQQQQADPKYLIGPLQSQRDRAANEVVLCSADNAALSEEIAKLRAKVADLEKAAAASSK
jgi:hypothetical protein